MRNLINFIIRFHALFLFILLEFFCLFLIVQNSNYHRASFINSANFITGNFYNTTSSITEYFSLKKVNKELAQENAELREQLRYSYYDRLVLIDTIIDSISPDLEQVFTYIPVKVIDNSTAKATNYIYLNKGSKQGIQKNMGVINQDGVVGLITNVSPNFSVAMSLLHKKMNLSAKLATSGEFGSVVWPADRPNEASLLNIPSSAVIEKGDEIITSGYSDFFPEGIPIGTIKGFKVIPGTSFYEISVDLSTDFTNLDFVYVVNNLFIQEIRQLEEEVILYE